MNHLGEGMCHEAKHRCRYSIQYDNRIYTCKVSTAAHLYDIHRAELSLCATDFVITLVP